MLLSRSLSFYFLFLWWIFLCLFIYLFLKNCLYIYSYVYTLFGPPLPLPPSGEPLSTLKVHLKYGTLGESFSDSCWGVVSRRR
jgi:hypothetical protein